MAETTKDKLDRARARAREMATKVWHGSKGSLLSAGVGFGAFYVEGALRGMDFFSTDPAKGGPYRVPIAMGVGGHFLKRKHHDSGTALLAIAGYQLANELKQRADAAKSKTATATVATTPGTTATPAAATGYGDAPAFLPPGNAGAMFDQAGAMFDQAGAMFDQVSGIGDDGGEDSP